MQTGSLSTSGADLQPVNTWCRPATCQHLVPQRLGHSTVVCQHLASQVIHLVLHYWSNHNETPVIPSFERILSLVRFCVCPFAIDFSWLQMAGAALCIYVLTLLEPEWRGTTADRALPVNTKPETACHRSPAGDIKAATRNAP